MAKISAKFPIVAALATTTYGSGEAVGRLISVSTQPTQNNVQLYADDALAEEANDVSSVSITLGTDTVPILLRIFSSVLHTLRRQPVLTNT